MVPCKPCHLRVQTLPIYSAQSISQSQTTIRHAEIISAPLQCRESNALPNVPMNASIQFFDTQFQRQIESKDFELNPFERAVLPFVRGRAVDLGCGLGNLSMAAADQCSSILALDASRAAVDALKLRAGAANAPIVAQVADLAVYELPERFDTVLCIGLLMFFPPSIATSWIERIKSNTEKNGIAAINVLIEGTTFLDMFEQGRYTLFAEDALRTAFYDWQVEYTAIEEFCAPKGTVKRFATIVVRNT